MSSNGDCTNDIVPHRGDRARSVSTPEQDVPLSGGLRPERYPVKSVDLRGRVFDVLEISSLVVQR